MRYRPYPYQQHATEHIIDNKAAGLFLDMGLGKTVSTLTAVDRLMNEELEVNKVLVIAPKRVAEDTWITEKDKWDHLKHLKLSLVLGTEKQRKAALQQKADIYIINRENVVWLVALYSNRFPFDMWVVDESSSFKSPKAQRFKALRQVRPFAQRVVILTGTPAPNSYLDLWPQLYLLDKGERLGETYLTYRNKFFRKENDYSPHSKFELIAEEDRPDYYANKIFSKISDICISMKAKDYLQLPERINRTVNVRFHGDLLKKYQDFEREQVLALFEGGEISAINAAALNTKLLQFANGAIYDDDKNHHEIHDEKIEALEEILESANGTPVLVFYSYRHDVHRILNKLKKYHPQELKGSDHIKEWNEGKVSLMLAHPASAGHGLNMQAGGNIIVWFGLSWSLELYQQANARLDRQGQTKPVIVHHLVAKGTMDEEVMQALENKAAGQEQLMEAVKARIKKYLNQKSQ